MCYVDIAVVISVPIIYLGCLYLFDRRRLPRDHPKTIIRRLCGVSTACVIISILTFIVETRHRKQLLSLSDFLSVLGFRYSGFGDLIFPCVLTMILFFGPLAEELADGCLKDLNIVVYLKQSIHDCVWLRNHIFAPVTEEFAFRSCTLPILLHCTSWKWTIFIGPLWFSLAHYHNAAEYVTTFGRSVMQALMISTFQAAYTYVFGVYASFLFLKTKNFLAVVLVHAFCNHMGFPDFGAVFKYESQMRTFLCCCYVSGLLIFSVIVFMICDIN